MKKALKTVALVIVIVISFFLIKRFYRSNYLPSFEYKATNNNSFTNDDLDKDKAAVFIYYSTECSDCKNLNSYFDLFKSKEEKINFILVAQNTQKQKIVDFLDVSKLSNFRGKLLIDTQNDFPSDFSLGIQIALPTILYYDKEGKFVKKIESYEEIKYL